MNPQIESLIFNTEKMPALPAVYTQIKEAIENPESTFEDIAHAASNDQNISARLLSLANSSFYGYPSSVSTIPDALTVIGLQQFKNMALCACVIDTFKDIPGALIDIDEFWRKSIACGLCARVMALELREANSERFFLGGLMHKIGRLVLILTEPDKAVEIFARSHQSSIHMHSVETEMLGFNHYELGGDLLESWELPTPICELVRHCSRPVLATSAVQDVSLIHIADFITESLNMGNAGDLFVPEFSDAAWGYSGLDESRLHYIVDELDRQFEEVCNVFLSTH